jgi:hypothetical protein
LREGRPRKGLIVAAVRLIDVSLGGGVEDGSNDHNHRKQKSPTPTVGNACEQFSDRSRLLNS